MPKINIPTLTESPRKCPNGIIAEYLTYTQSTECHTDFHQWMGIALISGAMARNFYLDMFYFKIFPNQYIVLVGEAGFSGKSTALAMASSVYKEAFERSDPPLIAQKITPSALVGALLRNYSNNGERASEGILISSELATLLGDTTRDDEILKVLTDLWDTHDKWEYETRSRGKEELENVCLSMWAGSTPTWLKTGISQAALEGGFFSRLILVNRERSPNRVALPMLNLSPQQAESRENVVHDLKRIMALPPGTFELCTDAAGVYTEWYEDQLDKEVKDAPTHMRGYYARKRTMVLKLAMVLSFDTNDSRRITGNDILDALKILDDNEKHLRDLVNYLGATKEGGEVLYVKKELLSLWQGPSGTKRKNGVFCCSHATLQRKVSHRLTAFQLAQIIQTLEDENFLEKELGRRGGTNYLTTDNSFTYL